MRPGEHVLGREPTADEKQPRQKFWNGSASALGSQSRRMPELVRGLLNLNEFLYVD